jgi:ribosomal protein L16 Arg81 hydroxylase
MDKLDFSYLISPLNAADFFAQHWQQSALLMKRGEDEADRYRRLIDVVDAPSADAIVRFAAALPAEAVEVIARIRSNEESGETSTEAIRKAGGQAGDALADSFSKGATIRVKAIERFCEPLGALCRNLEAELGFPLRANLYCTPENSRGFDLHFDTHEVFVLQLFGKKQWQIFEPTVRLPLEFVPPLPFENDGEALKRARGSRTAGPDNINDAELGPPALEALLEAGDCLYVPRGFVHQAAAHDEPSVHLTIGVHVLTWLDLLSVALGQAAYRNEDLRRALPVGLLKQPSDVGGVGEVGEKEGEFEEEFNALVQRFGRDADFANAVSEMVESFARRPGRAMLMDHHREVGELDGVDVDNETRLASHGPLRFYLAADGTMAGLKCNGKELWLPMAFAPALRFVTERNVFRLDEIPGLVSDRGKVAFVRHLLKDGFLRIAQ